MQEECANRLYRVYIYIAAIRWWRIMNILLIIKWSHVDVMRLSLSLRAWWLGEEAPPKSLSFCHHAPEALTRWQQNVDSYRGDLCPWWFWQLCFCSVWGRFPAEISPQLSTQLSAGLCSPDWRRFHTLRCTSSNDSEKLEKSLCVRDKAEDLCWMPVVFGPSDHTASLIGMIL